MAENGDQFWPDFRGRTYLVSGCSSGIGLEVSRLLLENGASLIGITRDVDRTGEIFDGLPKKSEAIYIGLDLSRADENVVLDLGQDRKVHGFVHAAGIASSMPVRHTKDKNMVAQMRLNTFSLIWIFNRLRRDSRLIRGDFSLVGVSSVLSSRGVAGAAGYSASKGALESAIRVLAAEFADRSWRFNSVRAGTVSTPMTERLFEQVGEDATEQIAEHHPLGIGTPRDIASSVLFLLSPRAKWITGTSLVVDGGYSVV